MPGKIQVEQNGIMIQSFDLIPGINHIGRRSEPGQRPEPGEILINCDDDHVHRKYHCTIEVASREGRNIFILSPFKGAFNFTLLGVELARLHQQDQVYLQHGSEFHLSENIRIRFLEK